METQINSTITKDLLTNAMSYQEYMTLLLTLLDVNKTTGENQSETMLAYGKMNVHRMKRLNKTIQLQPELQKVLDSLTRKMTFLIITEGWCGDAAQNVPVFNVLQDNSDKIDVRLILRDKNLNTMDDFLTNRSRSIPKLIALDSETSEVLGTWGPRPKAAQHMVTEFKKIENGDYSEFVKEVQLWYAHDKTVAMQKELIELLNDWN